MPSSDRVARRVADLKRDIFTVAAQLFTAQGIEATTVDEICAKADVPRRTLSYHFPTKSDLVRAMMQAGQSQLLQAIEAGTKSCGPTSDRVELAFDLARRFVIGGPLHPDVVPFLIQASRDGSMEEARGGVRLFDAVRMLLEGPESEESERPSQADTEALTAIVLGSLYAVFLEKAQRGSYDLETELKNVSDRLVRMLRADASDDHEPPGSES